MLPWVRGVPGNADLHLSHDRLPPLSAPHGRLLPPRLRHHRRPGLRLLLAAKPPPRLQHPHVVQRLRDGLLPHVPSLLPPHDLPQGVSQDLAAVSGTTFSYKKCYA